MKEENKMTLNQVIIMVISTSLLVGVSAYFITKSIQK